jgi:hypothetical protein
MNIFRTKRWESINRFLTQTPDKENPVKVIHTYTITCRVRTELCSTQKIGRKRIENGKSSDRTRGGR